MPKPAHVRRLDCRTMTPVDLDSLEYYDPPEIITYDLKSDWVLSRTEVIRVYRHPEFLFVASVMEIQYRGPRPGDAFKHPLAGRLETHIVAREIPEEEGGGRPPATPKPPTPTRLRVCRSPASITLDCVPQEEVDVEQAAFLEILLKNEGHWVEPAVFNADPILKDVGRRDRIKKKLSKPILAMIDKKPGGGYKLAVPPLA